MADREMKKAFKKIIEAQSVDPTAVVLLQANIGERERNLSDLWNRLRQFRLSNLRHGNTSVIAADAYCGRFLAKDDGDRTKDQRLSKHSRPRVCARA